MHFIQFLCFLSFGATAWGNIASCTEEPALVVDAGSDLSLKIRNAFGARCSAELVFANEVPSMTWYFEPAECAGSQLAQFSIPFDVPNGNAYITWQCEDEGTVSCNRIMISKGSPVLTATPRLITETARCMSLTTFMTHVVTPDMGNPTGVFQDITPIATDTVSTPLPETPNTSVDIVSSPATPRTPKTPSGYKTFIGTGETRKPAGGETSARLWTDTPAPTTTTPINSAKTTPFPTTTTTITAPITNTATVTVPVVIPVPDPTSITTEELTTNEPTYITVTSIISACPTLMKL